MTDFLSFYVFLHNYTQFIHFCIFKISRKISDLWLWSSNMNGSLFPVMTNFVSRFTWHDTFPNIYLAVVGNQWFAEIGIYLESTWKRGGPSLKSLVYSRKGNVLRSLKEECHADDVKQKRDRPYEPSQPTNGTFVPSMKPADLRCVTPERLEVSGLNEHTRDYT